MRWTGPVLMLLVVGTALADRAYAAEIVRPLVVVRTYPATLISGDDWMTTARATTGLLDAAGIDVQWVNCGDASRPRAATPARCDAPLQSNEVALRIVRGRASGYRGELPLGESLVDGGRRCGTLATIYLDRVEWLARAGNVRVTTLLARAIAHELGHLLLGTSTHGARGLMRPVWTRGELLRGRAADWFIAEDDGRRMRLAFTQRVQPIPETLVARRGE